MDPKAIYSSSRPRTAGPMTVVRLLLLLLAGLLAGSCGAGDDGSGAPGGTLQIDINIPTSTSISLGSRTSSIDVGGSVSESPYGKVEGTVCNCVGFGCFFDPQCTTMYYPRVDVTVQNTATGQYTIATLLYNTSSPGESGYAWHAAVSLVPGSNRVVAQASDGRGYQGSDSITIQNP